MYVNEYIIAVLQAKKSVFIAAIKVFAKVAIDFGAIEIFEN